MNTLVLLLERDSTWSPRLWATQQAGATSVDGQVVVEQGMEWISIVRDDDVLADFDELEMERLGTMVSAPAAYLVEWRGSTLLANLLRAAAKETRAAIDNDHGLLVSVREVADRPPESWILAKQLP